MSFRIDFNNVLNGARICSKVCSQILMWTYYQQMKKIIRAAIYIHYLVL